MHGKPGFIWTVESYSRDGKLLDSETRHNLLPEQGLNHWVDVLLGLGSQNNAWHIGLYAGDYTPVPGDTMANFPVSATEFVNYMGTGRKPYTPGTTTSGVNSNFNAPAEFEFTADGTVYGGFLASSSGKSATSGVLLSAIRFAVPKYRELGEVLKVRAAVGLVSI